jgi:predicted  nucleic acid-binding Zn-ribbon protein
MKINVEAVLQREKERLAEVKPLPRVRIITDSDTLVPKPGTVSPSLIRRSTPPPVLSEKDTVLKELWAEKKTVRKERDKLSTKTFFLVEDITKKLRKEGSTVVRAFQNGEIPVPALKEHYARIQAHTDKLKVLEDKIRYVEQYNALPKETPLVSIDNGETKDIKALHYEIRRLDDLIHKCNKKIESAKSGIKKPKNSLNLEKWRLKIELADAKRTDLKQQLKRLQYESREQRTIAQ